MTSSLPRRHPDKEHFAMLQLLHLLQVCVSPACCGAKLAPLRTNPLSNTELSWGRGFQALPSGAALGSAGAPILHGTICAQPRRHHAQAGELLRPLFLTSSLGLLSPCHHHDKDTAVCNRHFPYMVETFLELPSCDFYSRHL
jgi:hypothetical protein